MQFVKQKMKQNLLIFNSLGERIAVLRAAIAAEDKQNPSKSFRQTLRKELLELCPNRTVDDLDKNLVETAFNHRGFLKRNYQSRVKRWKTLYVKKNTSSGNATITREDEELVMLLVSSISLNTAGMIKLDEVKVV